METNQEHLRDNSESRKNERGNVLIYVLIAIALFAALSFTLGRQTDTGEAGTISDDKLTLYATQMIDYAAQVKSVIDQMEFQGIRYDDMDFTLSTDADFENQTTTRNIYKVYHPAGGGLIDKPIPEDVLQAVSSGAKWHLGRFNNVEWTPTTDQEIILTAHQISEPLCKKLNTIITGSDAIPQLSGNIGTFFVDTSTNEDLENSDCNACIDKLSLCVENGTGDAYSFYNIIVAR